MAEGPPRRRLDGWVGAVIVTGATMTKAARARDHTAVLRLSRELEWVGPGLIGPSSAVVIGLGVWLVLLEEEWAFSQLWIVLAVVLVGVSTIDGIYSGSEARRIAHRADERGPANREVRRRLSRLLWLGRLDLLILLAVLWLMVFKPAPEPVSSP